MTKLLEPLYPDGEPYATLTYGDLTFEIPYTLLHWWAEWISMGVSDSLRQFSVKTEKAFDQILHKMIEDSTNEVSIKRSV